MLFSFEDINECNAKPCDHNATCTNTAGSFVCVCITGYFGDGVSCQGTVFILFSIQIHLYLLDKNEIFW